MLMPQLAKEAVGLAEVTDQGGTSCNTIQSSAGTNKEVAIIQRSGDGAMFRTQQF
jgi:hypothetical protein